MSAKVLKELHKSERVEKPMRIFATHLIENMKKDMGVKLLTERECMETIQYGYAVRSLFFHLFKTY